MKNRKEKRAQRKANRKPKTGAGKAKVKSGINTLVTEVGKVMKRRDENTMFEEPAGTAFSATTSKDIVVKAKKSKEPSGGASRFMLPSLALAALAFFALKK